MYYTSVQLIHFFNKYDMEVFDVKKHSIHGSSIRVYVRKKEGKKRKRTEQVIKLLKYEKKLNLDINIFDNFSKKVNEHKIQIRNLLNSLKKEGNRIVGYGASGRGNTILNYCGITTGILDYIVDASPERYGRYTPGTHIPIVPPEMFRKDNPDYVLLLAWNYKDTIMQKEKRFYKAGGKFIIPLPVIKII